MLKPIYSIIVLLAFTAFATAAQSAPIKMSDSQLDGVVGGGGCDSTTPDTTTTTTTTTTKAKARGKGKSLAQAKAKAKKARIKGNNGWGNGADPSNPGSSKGKTAPSKLANGTAGPGVNTNPTRSTGR